MTNERLEAVLAARTQDRDLITAVGLVGMTTGHVDIEIATILANLIESPWGPQLAFGQNTSTNVTYIRELLKAVKPTPLTEDILAALKAAEAVLDERNALVHSLWGGDGVSTLRFRRWNRRELPRPVRTVEGTLDVYESMLRVIDQLTRAWSRLDKEKGAFEPA
ncbi:MAG: hypothetical protein ABIP57_00575 [Jatrophihabitantaceae bacterium]